MSESAEPAKTSADSSESERYELTDLFDDMGSETELVLKTIGIVLTVVALCGALAFPIFFGRANATDRAPAGTETSAQPDAGH